MKSLDKNRSQSLFQRVLSWYCSYAKLYHSSDADCQENILLKQKHSIRVAGLGGAIGRKLGLPQEDIMLAKIIGLLHDVARFEQYTRYQTFNDKASIDHGELGAQLIDKVIPLQKIDSDLKETISCAIFHHNKISIPSRLSTRKRLHARIVRDADKLDIIYLTCCKIQNGSKFPEPFPVGKGGLSSEIIQAMARKQPVDYKMIQSIYDFHLLKIGWVYDFNFRHSLSILQKRRSIDILKAALPKSVELDKQLNQIESYILLQLGQPQLSECHV